MILPERAVFGEYSILFDLKANMSFRAKPDPLGDIFEVGTRTTGTARESLTFCMCCPKDILLDLCELYPTTHQALIELAIQKRDIYMHFMNEVGRMKGITNQSGVPRGIDS